MEGLQGARDGNGLAKKKKKGESGPVRFSAVSGRASVSVCLYDKGKRGEGGVLLRLSIMRDQLMAEDDGAERGQGSKPCIVSLAPALPWGSLPTLAPHPPSIPLLPHAHLHTFINTERRRAGGCSTCVAAWLQL
ncbi:hypothetical protein NQZ68_017461 [Dissostichus eleginoides]|nr:hypothetical protein NQZ68_017461 [Dissostichus eleginoides]